MTIFNRMETPGQDPDTSLFWTVSMQRREQWYEHKLLWNIHSLPFPESPLCNLYTFFPETSLPLSHLMQCLYNFESYYTSGWDSEEVICVRKRYRKGGWKRNRSCVFPGTKTHLWVGTHNEEIINHLIIMCSPGPAEGFLPTPHTINSSQHSLAGDISELKIQKKNTTTTKGEKEKTERHRMEGGEKPTPLIANIYWCLLWARYHDKQSFNSCNYLRGYHPYFTDKETEVQRDQVTWPWFQKIKMAGASLESKQSDLEED